MIGKRERELEKPDDISGLGLFLFLTKACFLLNAASIKIFMSIHPQTGKIR